MRIALDTNILVYAEGLNGSPRQRETEHLLAVLATETVMVPVQVLGELARVLSGKGRRSPASVRDTVLDWSGAAEICDTTSGALLAAMDLRADHGLAIWDAIIFAVVAESDCRLLLSEDMQDGFTWRGVTCVNPYASEPHPALRTLLS